MVRDRSSQADVSAIASRVSRSEEIVSQNCHPTSIVAATSLVLGHPEFSKVSVEFSWSLKGSVRVLILNVTWFSKPS